MANIAPGNSQSLDLRRIAVDERSLVEEALNDWHSTSFSVRAVLSGKSGASVYLIEISLSEFSGVSILKVGEKKSVSAEISRHKEAGEIFKGTDVKIPEIKKDYYSENNGLFIMTVAGWSLLEVDPLSHLPHGELTTACCSAADIVLNEWNARSNHPLERQTAHDLLYTLVERQLGPQSRIPKFIEDNLGISVSDEFIRLSGDVIANPFAFSSSYFAGSRIEVSVSSGLSHGDLHTDNLLFSKYENKTQNGAYNKQVYFIDFSDFSSKKPLLFDLAYLEMHLLVKYFGTHASSRWISICRVLMEMEDPNGAEYVEYHDDVGILRIIGALRQKIATWIKSSHGMQTEDLKKQLYLTRVAAGLNFCNKRSLDDNDEVASRKKKYFAFIYAAYAATQLLRYSRVQLPVDGVSMHPIFEIAPPSSDAWRSAWDACSAFSTVAASYILLGGTFPSSVTDFSIQTIGRLPWSAILDLDPGGLNSRLANLCLEEKRKAHSVDHLFAHQASDVDPGATIPWIAIDPDADVNQIQRASLPQWKSTTLPHVRRIASRIASISSPARINVVVSCIERVNQVKLRAVLSAIQESAADNIDVIIITDPSLAFDVNSVYDDPDSTTCVACDINDLALGVYQVLGDPSLREVVWLPVRRETGETRQEPLEPAEAAFFRSCVELFPSSPSVLSEARSPASFIHGATITLEELDSRVDVDRDITKELVKHIRNRLKASPNESYAIEHSPGSGGTTVARRVAWELRDEFPCVDIQRYASNTVEIIEAIFRRTALPVLVVCEATRVAIGRRDSMFAQLRARNVRFLLLDVRRRLRPQTTEHSVALSDPMSLTEAKRFLRVYSARAPRANQARLTALASDGLDGQAHRQYRSAFFFGLYAFERDFKKVDDFVSGALDGASSEIRQYVGYLALISRYSQERVPLNAFAKLMGLKIISSKQDIEKIFGESLLAIVACDGSKIAIKHPIIAEVVLWQILQPSDNSNMEAWRIPLREFCRDFVDRVSLTGVGEGEAFREILYDLFLERQTTQGIGRTYFSELLETLQSIEGERDILKLLCERFPDDAYFVSHYARNINYRKTGTFEEAEAAAIRAINLDDKDEDHHHILGMVYRFRIERMLNGDFGEFDVGRIDQIEAVRVLFEKAKECFQTCRKLQPDSTYPFITPLQTSVSVMSKMYSLSGAATYGAFLRSGAVASAWCREILDYASEVSEALHQYEANGQPSERRVRCDADLDDLLGNYQAVVDGLSSLLSRSDVRKSPVRRSLSNLILTNAFRKPRFEPMELRKVVSLSEENLNENPASVLDLRHWIRAYRMLSGFDITAAIDKFRGASLISDEIEILYYLYILNFVAGIEGVQSGFEECRRTIERCRRKTQEKLLTGNSYEWLGRSRVDRPLPLVHHSELGSWSTEANFFTGVAKLAEVDGRIEEIRSPQAGTITVFGVPAFFAPRSEFLRSRDINTRVSVMIGFSYQGLRAWKIKRLP